jgi:glycosyltransferase involved in cell wall biosynthesis
VANQTLSIVVPTRNRPDHASACALSILRNNSFSEVLFVDQSDGPQTSEALARLSDSRIRCVRSSLRGATNARNTGIDQTTGELIAFCDDDCRVSEDWVDRILHIFTTDPAAAVICGGVTAPEELRRQGFVAVFEPQVREWVDRLPPSSEWGLTANLAVRRAVLSDVGKFDPFLGVGSPLPAGEEPDFLIRVLRRGYKIVNAREVEVEHLGVRAHGEETSKLYRAYGKGTAAALMKHVRLGDRGAAVLGLEQLDSIARGVFKNLRNGHRPFGVGYMLAFLSGGLASFKFRVNTTDRLYALR